MPDEQARPGDEAGEPISQDALDALLSATGSSGGIDDSDALDISSLAGDGTESDLDFGLGEDSEDLADEAGLVDDGQLGGDFGGDAASMLGGFGAFGGGGGNIDLESFDMPMDRMPSESDNDDFLRVRDIPLDVTVELGRTRMLIRDILDLSTGAIIELDKIAGEPVDLFANGLLVARGEVIVIDDNFGVRITEIITAAERLQATHAQSIAA